MQDMILYLIHEEFVLMPPHGELVKNGNTIVYILMSILGILDHDVCYFGIFKMKVS